MKKFRLILAGAFLLSLAYSCTPENQVNEYQTDKDCVTNPDGTLDCSGDDNDEN